MRRALLISVRAEADLSAIWRWTFETFGEAQADRYLDMLEEGMRRCCNDPESGRDRGGLREGYRSSLVGRHVVFFTFTRAEVVVQRVLHASMDFGTHLDSPDE